MSAFWSIYVIALVAINLIGCIVLIYFTGRSRPGDPKADETSHIWDETLTEYNKPMPAWWVNLFYATVFFAVGYLIYYPGAGAFKGVGGWSSAGQHDADMAEQEKQVAPLFAQFANVPVADLAKNAKAVELGHSVFANNCSMCHGSDAKGNTGFPNLTDTAWNWGGTPDDILTTVLNGRQAAMPSFAAVIGNDQAIAETAAYVQSLSGIKADPALAAAGKPRFEMVCTACHGPTGTGNPLLGAPNLTDGDWLYGSDIDTIKEGIIKGRAGMMPPHEPILGKDRARLVAAYVYSLTNKQ